MLCSLFRRWQRRHRPAASAVRRYRAFRPTLELLEERTLLSAYTVNSLADTGAGGSFNGDLRYALANAVSGDTIDFSVSGTISLTSALPTISQDITITGPGGLTVDGGGSFGIFAINAGATVSISGLRIANASAAAGGLNIQSGAAAVSNLSFDGADVLNAAGQTLTVPGTGTLYLNVSSRLENYGTVLLPDDSSILGDTTGAFNNYGTFQKTGGAGGSLFSSLGVAFNNYGAFAIDQGSFIFNRGIATTINTTAYAGSSFTGAAGTNFGFYDFSDFQAGSSIVGDTVYIASGSVAGSYQANVTAASSLAASPTGLVTFTGTVNGLGAVQTYDGTLDLRSATLAPSAYTLTSLNIGIGSNTATVKTAGAFTVAGAFHLNGTLQLTNALDVQGAFTVANGVIEAVGGPVTLTAAAGGTVAYLNLYNVSLVNPASQTLTVQGPGNLGLLTGSRLENYGTVDLPSDQSVIGGDTTGAFNNYGTFQKTGGDFNSGFQSYVQVSFNNHGAVQVDQGILSFLYAASGGTNTAYAGSSFTGAVGSHLFFYLDNDFQAGSTILGDDVYIAGGTGAGTFQANRSRFGGGAVTFTGTVNNLGDVTTYGGTLDLRAATLTPAAYMLTSLDVGSGSTVQTVGAYTVTGNVQLDGTLQVTNDLTVNGTFTSIGGSVQAVGGPITLAGNGGGTVTRMTLDGVTWMNPVGQTLTVQGGVANAGLSLINGSKLENHGVVDLPADESGVIGDSTAVFDNYGTFEKTGGSTGPQPDGRYYSYVEVSFNNYGAVELDQGFLTFNYFSATATTTAFAGSSFAGATGTELAFYNSVDLRAGSSIVGDKIYISSGTVSGAIQANITRVGSAVNSATGLVSLASTGNNLGALLIFAGGRLNLDGLSPIAQSVTSLDVEGTLAGSGFWQINDSGSYHQGPAGVLEVKIGGTIPGTQYDQIVIAGATTLNGVLTTSLVNGFTPSASDVITFIRNAAAVTGAFASLPQGAVVDAGAMPLALDYNDVSLSPIHLVGSAPPATAGVPFSFTVTAKDALGNVVTGYTGTVHFTSSDLLAGLPGDLPFTTGDAGTRVFSNLTLFAAGAQSITVTDTAFPSITGSAAIGVTPTVATTLVLSGLAADAPAGTPQNLTVTAYDAFGNVATGYTGTVQFATSDSSATGLPVSYTFQLASAGTKTFSVTLNTPGTQSITGTDVGDGTITGTTTELATRFHATFLVANTNDNGVGSLRQAILDANANSGTDTIGFQPGVVGSILLVSGLPGITDDVTIIGPGAGDLAIDGNGVLLSQLFNNGQPLTATQQAQLAEPILTASATVSISGLTFTNAGVVNAFLRNGGAIVNNGDLTFIDCTFSNDSAVLGGAIYSGGTSLTIRGSTFTGNSADGGGAIYVADGRLTIGSSATNDSAFTGNTAGATGGGAIFMTSDSRTPRINQGGGPSPNTIADSTFTNNTATAGSGGAILNLETDLVLSADIFTGNFSGVDGGAVANLVVLGNWAASLVLTGCDFDSNGAGVNGGAVANEGSGGILASTTIDDSSFTNALTTLSAGGSGGAIYNTNGTVAVADSVFDSLFVFSNGGAIDNDSGGALTVGAGTVFTNNLANGAFGGSGNGGAIHNAGSADLDSVSFGSNGAAHGGGGIYNDTAGDLIVAHTTFASNSAASGGGIVNNGYAVVSSSTFVGNLIGGGFNPAFVGGGIFNDDLGTLTLSNCTLTANSATAFGGSGIGGGIFNSGTLTVVSSTLAANSADEASGIFNSGGSLPGGFGGRGFAAGTLILGNSIVALNTNGLGSVDIEGVVDSRGFNLVGDGSGAAGFIGTDQVGDFFNPIDPLLGPLRNNGGPTQTMALQAGSPAIGMGDTLGQTGTFDQTGRPRVGPVDVGAYALAPATRLVMTLSTTSGTSPLNVSVTVQALDARGNAGAYYGTLEFSSTDGLATLPVDYRFQPGDHGAHTFAAILKTTGPQTLHVVDAVQRTLFATSDAITVIDGAPQVLNDSLAFGLVDATGFHPLPYPPTVRARTDAVFLIGSFSDPGEPDTSFTVTIDWDDGTVETVVPGLDFTFRSPGHIYQTDQTFHVTVTVTRTDGDGAVTASAPARVDFNAYDQPVQGIEIATAQPGQSARVVSSVDTTVLTPDGPVVVTLTVTATLYRDPGATTSASIIVAVIPPDADPALHIQVVEKIGDQVVLTASFDVRTVNVDGHDYATVTFGYYLPDGLTNLPVLSYFDQILRALEPVLGSTQYILDANGDPVDPQLVPPDRVIVNPISKTITVTFDSTSTPTLENLKGTVFTITIPLPSPAAPLPLNSPQVMGPNLPPVLPVPQAVNLPANIPLQLLQNNPSLAPANFISTPQLTLTLKLPQTLQTINSQAALQGDVGSSGATDEPAGPDAVKRQVMQFISRMLRQLRRIPYLDRLLSLTRLSELPVPHDDALVNESLETPTEPTPDNDLWPNTDWLNPSRPLLFEMPTAVALAIDDARDLETERAAIAAVFATDLSEPMEMEDLCLVGIAAYEDTDGADDGVD
ncbi:MAG: hypothetical protein K2R98_27890 [Gemmataceae bacterium]|nr:hypothetical protein [Gemmataceae bacterium]